MMSWLLILVGFVVLVYGANLLVNGASSLAAKLNVPNMVIGLTIVAFGTSAPELVVNAFAAMNGNTQIVMGNVLGSNIFNVALIVGVSALIFPLRVKTATTWIEIPLALLSAFVVLIIANDMFFDSAQSNVISRVEAIMLLAFFMIFLAYNIHVSKQGQGDEEVQVKAIPISKSIVFFVLGLVMLVVGGRLIVTYAVEIARNFGLSERIIALTIVSIGTSLPELATSIVAVTRRNVDLAVGNVVGSNIFNVFFVLGISGLFGKVEVVSENQIDIWMNIVFSFMLFLFIFTGKGRQVERWEGALFVLAYIAYLIFLF